MLCLLGQMELVAAECRHIGFDAAGAKSDQH